VCRWAGYSRPNGTRGPAVGRPETNGVPGTASAQPLLARAWAATARIASATTSGRLRGDVMARAVDDDMASLRGCRGEPGLQARPVRPEPAGQGEAAGNAQDDDGHVGKAPFGGAQLPQGRVGRGDVTVQLIGVDGAHDPPAPLEGQRQSAFHLLVARVHQDQARDQVRPAEGQQLGQDAAPSCARPARTVLPPAR